MGLQHFETWGSLEISIGLFDLFELMPHTAATANNLLTLRHTVKLSTQDGAGFFFFRRLGCFTKLMM